ncbi:MAG: class I SAM-dependent methyltransferase [Gemmatimonadales bacterium]
MTAPETGWALALFRKSVLKQAKLDQVLRLLEDPAGKSNLDIGGDNGVISYLLRQRGGRWASADLDEATVAAIRQLVGTDVYRLDGPRTPFADQTFDQIVIVDYLEHIEDDQGFGRELARILKPQGTLIVNVPHVLAGSPLVRFRHRIGLTDAWHGHLRPGYTVASLEEVLGPAFRIERSVAYSRFGSELVDTLLNGAFELIRRRQGRHGAPTGTGKGSVVTGSDVRRYRTQFRVLALLYPALRLLASLDRLLPWHPGHKLIVRATRR